MTDAAPAGARRVVRFSHVSTGQFYDAAAVAAPEPIGRDWAWGDATGRGVRVCVVDSGVEAGHPGIGPDVRQFTAAPPAPAAPHGAGHRGWTVAEDTAGDVSGHGTACAGIIRAVAPGCELTSVRVLDSNLQGNGEALLAALEWAVRQRFALVNVSLSTRRAAFKEHLHDLTDEAWFAGVTLVSAAHNGPVDSYPWRFPSVISVGAHAVPDTEHVESNPAPPVDLFALGVDVTVPWRGGSVRRVSGNSFAAPRITGLCARILERHPGFRTPQLRHVLTATAGNIRAGSAA
ncbi:S8 family serine peptidase [Streptomyces sp. NBC_01190]|uniref:S8 family serine peptidase n=1 Tax=Streptomyces sp. NBC_01190 TaxID=2903767 RepID=UPI00386B5D3A|nr:S8 family serine peptidase [Streptomyces sp. NBC_01190]